MTILVTGGAGYIGSHTVKELVKRGYDVVVYDNLDKGHRGAVKDIPLVVGNIQNSELLAGTIQKYAVKSVIHFAAYSLVAESMAEPQKYYYNNVYGTLNLLNVLLKNNVKRIVFSSTAAVYGESEETPITEGFPRHPTNVYGRTKLMIEEVLQDYNDAYGLKYISLRYFNACGADESGDIGEDHAPETHLIPLVLQTALGKREKITVFGDDYPTFDGTCIRDYIHVSDLAQAHVLALQAMENGVASDVFNLGNGNGFSVKEVVEAAERVTGKKIRKDIGLRRSGDPAVLIASPEKAGRDLGWKPEYTKIEKIIATAWQWQQRHPNGYGA